MSITLIIGKPGSGKSYFAVSKIAEKLCDFARYEKREGTDAEGGFWTNLKLNVEEVNNYVKIETGQDFDSGKYLHYLEDSFFYEEDGKTPRKWWDDIPVKQTLVVDEVHQYIPAHGAGGREYMERFTQYISQHRHYQHEIFMITQHTDTIHKNILCMAEGAYHVMNVKTRVIPFLGIPFADLDVVKEAWGCKQQLANIVYGNYIGRSFKKESLTSIILRPEIFRLYVSHMHIQNAEGDKASLHLGRFGSILWLLRKHGFQVSVKVGILVGCAFAVRYMLTEAPTILSDSLAGGMAKEEEKTKSRATGEVPVVEKTVDAVLAPEFSGILVYGKDFIIAGKGRVKIGEEFLYYGEKVRLQSVDFVCRTVDVERLRSSDCQGSGLEQVPIRSDEGTGK